MLIVLLIFGALVFVLCTHRCKTDYNGFCLWAIVFAVYSVYMLVSDYYIGNPRNEYFISVDQTYFYEMAEYFGGRSWVSILHDLGKRTDDYPRLFIIVNALWVKFGMLIGVTDFALFIKLREAFLGSLIPLVMYKTFRLYVPTARGVVRKLIIFALCTPLLSFSVQIMRDVEVALIYSIIIYLCVNEKIKCRYLWVALLIVIAYYYRAESGLFAISFVFISLTDKLSRSSIYVRLIAFACLAAVAAAYVPFILDTADHTLSAYSERSASHAAADSMGMAIWNKLGPMAPFAKVLFTIMLPFPLWLPLQDVNAYVWLRGVEVIWGFYWLPVCVLLLTTWWKHRKDLPREFSYYLLAAFLFLLLNSMGEFNSRRMMAVYPMMYVLYLRLRYRYKMRLNATAWCCFWLLCGLNVAYFLIK